MRALIFKELAPIETIEIEEIPKQTPQKGQVLIKLTSAGLNRADLLFPEGRYFSKPDFTNTYSRLGFEGAGIIEQVGLDVSFNIGDRVAIAPLSLDVSRQGCFSEYGVYDANTLIPTPDSIPDHHAASIWMQYLTAWGGLVIDGELKKGQTVVITAASSSVGIAAIQVANMIGAVSIATTTSEDKVSQLKQLGAQHVINMKSDDYVDQIKSITKNKGTCSMQLQDQTHVI